jgi:hypothetical protein
MQPSVSQADLLIMVAVKPISLICDKPIEYINTNQNVLFRYGTCAIFIEANINSLCTFFAVLQLTAIAKQEVTNTHTTTRVNTTGSVYNAFILFQYTR